ncbi:hypothetical protein [Thomasclavelia cocleata]|uniref:hypothetical protein n=1 Tax=Thomasclavelia cocleata TaxID=69824 RepID=UPI002729E8DD|nr:hypothetical protein [Thomasclavelia cocleata]
MEDLKRKAFKIIDKNFEELLKAKQNGDIWNVHHLRNNIYIQIELLLDLGLLKRVEWNFIYNAITYIWNGKEVALCFG